MGLDILQTLAYVYLRFWVVGSRCRRPPRALGLVAGWGRHSRPDARCPGWDSPSKGRPDDERVLSASELATLFTGWLSGQRIPRIERPAGLTEREAEVVGPLLARGLQTKQVARALGISVKAADRHVQNAYGKIGVSTRAGAALFAMQLGLATWGKLPISHTAGRS